MLKIGEKSSSEPELKHTGINIFFVTISNLFQNDSGSQTLAKAIFTSKISK